MYVQLIDMKMRKNLILVIWDLLVGQISSSAQLSMKKSFITSWPVYEITIVYWNKNDAVSL